MTQGAAASVTFRALRDDGQALLAQATLGNVNWSRHILTPEQVVQTPALAHYFTPWPSNGDFGLVAENNDGAAIAVAWVRHFAASDPGYGFVDEALPELSIWVAQPHRGIGLGTRLLTGLLEQARSQNLPGISLSVESGNPARALYERVGFEPAGSGFDAETLVLRFWHEDSRIFPSHGGPQAPDC